MNLKPNFSWRLILLFHHFPPLYDQFYSCSTQEAQSFGDPLARTRVTVGMSRESSDPRKCFLFSYRWSRRCRGFILKHVVSRRSRKGRNMWGFSPLSTLLLFSIFTAVHSEEKQDVRKGAIVRARLEVCSGPYFLDRMKAYCGSCILFSLYSSNWY